MPFDATPTPSRAKILMDALELLQTRGWRQGFAVGSDGSLCMFAAIREAGHLFSKREFDMLDIPWPAAFNDAPGRTFEEVEQWMLDRISEALG